MPPRRVPRWHLDVYENWPSTTPTPPTHNATHQNTSFPYTHARTQKVCQLLRNKSMWAQRILCLDIYNRLNITCFFYFKKKNGEIIFRTTKCMCAGTPQALFIYFCFFFYFSHKSRVKRKFKKKKKRDSLQCYIRFSVEHVEWVACMHFIWWCGWWSTKAFQRPTPPPLPCKWSTYPKHYNLVKKLGYCSSIVNLLPFCVCFAWIFFSIAFWVGFLWYIYLFVSSIKI